MSKVHAGQQRQGGSGNHFEAQVRHTGGKKKKAKKMSEKQRRKKLYAIQAGIKFKLKKDFMSVCRCNGRGTCEACVQKRRQKELDSFPHGSWGE